MKGEFVQDPFDEGVEAYYNGELYDVAQHPRWQDGWIRAAQDDTQ